MCFSNKMPERVSLAVFAASVKHSIITEKIVDNTAIGGAVDKEEGRLLTSNWHPPVGQGYHNLFSYRQRE